MFELRVLEIAKELGMQNLYSVLRTNGFSRYHATEISQGRMRRFEIVMLYRLCKVFKCTLNDLFEYVPKSEKELDKHSFLAPMLRSRAPMDVPSRLMELDNEKRKLLIEFLERL